MNDLMEYIGIGFMAVALPIPTDAPVIRATFLSFDINNTSHILLIVIEKVVLNLLHGTELRLFSYRVLHTEPHANAERGSDLTDGVAIFSVCKEKKPSAHLVLYS